MHFYNIKVRLMNNLNLVNSKGRVVVDAVKRVLLLNKYDVFKHVFTYKVNQFVC